MTFAFEKLLVYQKAVDFTDRVCCTTENFARGCGFLVDQLNRATLSISANIAETSSGALMTLRDSCTNLTEDHIHNTASSQSAVFHPGKP